MRKHWRDLPAFAPPQAVAGPLKITGLRAWRLKEPVSGRRYTVVRMESQAGAGWGEGGPVPASSIDAARAAAIGRKATDAEYVRHALAGQPALEAAVNNAMLDLAARSTGVPIYRYLGGPTRYKARLLAQVEGATEDALAESVQRAAQQGFRAFAFPIPSRDAMWRMQAYVDSIRKRVDRLQAAAGSGRDFVLDANATLTPGDAGFIATALERAHLLWLDEPTATVTSDALAKITGESVMPVGAGRNILEASQFQSLLRFGCIQIVRPDAGRNSMLKLKRVAAVAETNYVAIGPYHNGGPVGTAASIHLAASLPNFFIQQVPRPSAEQDRAMRAESTSGDREAPDDGFARLINRPGLGFDLSEPALNKYSEERL